MRIDELLGWFDRVYCINLDRRADRWQRFLSQVPQDWPFVEIERLPAVDGQRTTAPRWWRPSPGAWGCYRSHAKVIENALSDGLESVLILEDDALFGTNFTADVSKFLAAVPDDWGMLYLGGQHIETHVVPPKPINDYVCVPHNVNRTHAYALRRQTLSAIYSHLHADSWQPGHHIDHHLGRFLEKHDPLHPVYCPLEWLVGQSAGVSDIACSDFPDRFWMQPVSEPLSESPFIAITGLRSSGASALAGLVWQLGVNLGDRLGGYGSNPGGQCDYEDAELADICESLIPFPSTQLLATAELRDRLRHWIFNRRAVALQYRSLAGGKYPLLCRLGEYLLEHCGPRLRLIVSDRKIEESILSLQKRCPHLSVEQIESHQRWLQAGLSELISSVPRSQLLVVRYHDLLADPFREAHRITDFLELEIPNVCDYARAVRPIQHYVVAKERSHQRAS